MVDQSATPSLPAVLIRGGTSKGVFLHLKDLPPFGEELDQLLLNLMGTPDPMQIDGLGGTYSSTSKVIIVAPGDRPGIDVRYWFAQIGVDEPIVDWSGNCGNLTTAVGGFAIDEGLVAASEPVAELHLLNENTGVEIVAKVPVEGGRSKETGDLMVDGVPNPGAPVVTEFLDPGGAVLGVVLPTGNATDVVVTADGEYSVSIVDVTHPNAFVAGADLGVEVIGAQTAALNGDSELLARIERLRSACAELIAEKTGSKKQSPNIPRLILVSAPPADSVPAGTGICALGVSLGKFHHALPMTSAFCLGGAASISGTVAERLTRSDTPGQLTIAHPKGTVTVTATVINGPTGPDVASVGVVRTARRLMSGVAYLRPIS